MWINDANTHIHFVQSKSQSVCVLHHCLQSNTKTVRDLPLCHLLPSLTRLIFIAITDAIAIHARAYWLRLRLLNVQSQHTYRRNAHKRTPNTIIKIGMKRGQHFSEAARIWYGFFSICFYYFSISFTVAKWYLISNSNSSSSGNKQGRQCRYTSMIEKELWLWPDSTILLLFVFSVYGE